MTQQRVINIRDARVRTMAVGIKAMSISDKQVTLAVFRQLYEEDLIAADGHLNGLPWGIINYCPSKDCLAQAGDYHVDSVPHHHIVWQKGDELRRATAGKEASFDCYRPATAKDYIAVTIRDIAMERCSEAMPKLDPSYSGSFYFERGGLRLQTEVSRELKSLTQNYYRQQEYRRQQAIVDDYEERYGPWHGDGSDPIGEPPRLVLPPRQPPRQPPPPPPTRPTAAPPRQSAPRRFIVPQPTTWEQLLQQIEQRVSGSRAVLMRQLDQEIAAEVARRERWRNTIKQLQALPQLFIAV